MPVASVDNALKPYGMDITFDDGTPILYVNKDGIVKFRETDFNSANIYSVLLGISNALAFMHGWSEDESQESRSGADQLFSPRLD